jgi:two-component system cell cycle response regulator
MARILIIEDNRTNLELMTYLLSAFGHTTIAAYDGLQGVEAAARERPDLVICDLELPGINGYEVARRLRVGPVHRIVPLVAVTAFAMVGDRDKALAAGFDGYIPKPIVPETFVRELEKFLGPSHSPGPEPPRAAREPKPAQPPPSPRGTILVVDDSAVNLDLISSTLEPFGYTIVKAGSAAEALELLHGWTPDMILSDLHMPAQDGFAFFNAVRKSPALVAVPFVFVSSTVWGETDRMRALAIGATRFLVRPIEPMKLVEEIEACFPPEKHPS